MEIDVKSLQSLGIPQRYELPEASGIYFVINEAEEIEYIETAVNIRKRWVKGHGCAIELDSPKLCRIAWALIENRDERLSCEKKLIKTYKPRINLKLNPDATFSPRYAKARLLPKECLENPDLITVGEIAELRKTSIWAVRKLVRRGRIKPVKKISNVNYFSKQAILNIKHYERQAIQK